MSITIPPFVRSRSDRPDDDVDTLLRDFFHAETPKPWPMPPAVGPRNGTYANGQGTLSLTAKPVQPSRKPWALSSRLALAASLGGLLVGTWLLSGQFKGNPQPDDANLGSPSGSIKIREQIIQRGNEPTTLRFDVYPDSPTNMVDPF